jgi:hypothetical protein
LGLVTVDLLDGTKAYVPCRPLPFAGRVHLLLHDIPTPPTMD